MLKKESLSSPTNQERRGCDVTVGSEPLNLESPEAGLCPVAMAAQPAKQEEAEGRCPCLLWKTSQLSVACENGGR